ncbi:MAG TPA: 4-(cytidine 5'-diphospho)-2-C-methyl-D-erythritol kinase [Candidatus Sulfotelmatobacter sp.]|nr:4-(cytidine 5'-diphospho)-2-C-methyl-D-erythritol kinase [Candidatus Sulfotelmatobacter sp.]
MAPKLYNHSSMTVTVRSFAKINLGLRIGAARADGFHELLTVYQTIGLHDVIRVRVERGSGVEIRCEDPRVPRDESNTCYRMVSRAMAGLRAKGRAVIEIEKRLPVQGGLGGASANAVACLVGLERAVRKRLPAAERLRIAAEVGSDLPLFLIGGTVLGVGRGEQVYPLADLPAMPCVVLTPEIGVSTPKAFAEWDRRVARGLKPGSSGEADATLKGRSSTFESTKIGSSGTAAADLRSAGQPRAGVPTQEGDRQTRTDECVRPNVGHAESGGGKLTVGDVSDRMNELSRGLSAWLSEPYSSAPSSFMAGRGRAGNPLLWLVRAGIENDFEQVVFPEYPELCEGKRALERAGAKYASLSGSGSTLYGLFGSKRASARAVVSLRKHGWTAQATWTLTRKAYWRRMMAG